MNDEEHSPYLVTTTTTVRIEAKSAADARKVAEVLILLKPNSNKITKTINVEKVRN